MRIFLVLAILMWAAGAICSELDSYISSVEWFEPIQAETLPDSVIIRDDLFVSQGVEADYEKMLVGRADFCYRVKILSVERKLVYMPETDRYVGIAATVCELEEDLFYSRQGQLTIIWIGENVPGQLKLDKSSKLTLSPDALESLYVFGYLEKGFNVGIRSSTCFVGPNGEFIDAFGREISSSAVFSNISKRRIYTMENKISGSKNILLVGLKANGRCAYDTAGLPVRFNVIDFETRLVVGEIDIYLGGTQWAQAHKPNFEIGKLYMVDPDYGKDGRAILMNGKLNVFEIDGNQALGTSGVGVADIDAEMLDKLEDEK